MSEEKVRHWELLPGDRVVHVDAIEGSYPEGSVFRVDPGASFFPYWVQWDLRWRGRLPEGAYQSSCFHWAEMFRRGLRPVVTEKRLALLDELAVARIRMMAARKRDV